MDKKYWYEFGLQSNSWPFQEARKILDKINHKTPEKGYVLFETGYGPSGLPHIGTFGEVARTTMVMNAFSVLSDIPMRLFAFSDDLDGLRKIPDNVPNKESLKSELNKPLTVIPDPFGTHSSYGANMNARLCAFLDEFNFSYEFKSATECYQAGIFDDTIIKVLEHYDEIMEVMLASLREERQTTYSPILPICPETGIVLQVPVEVIDAKNGLVRFKASSGQVVEQVATGGKAKLQWKVDWAMRWAALGVDYEMHGKDLIPSAVLSEKICKILGSPSPITFNYELFLDNEGRKISKSKGNGLTIDEWLRYAPRESLSFFMYQSPKRAKRLYFDVIPKNVDEYLTFLRKYPQQEPKEQIENPVWHIHFANPPAAEDGSISFNLLLNLVSACNPDNEDILWGFIQKHDSRLTPATAPMLAGLIKYAMIYYHDFIKPNKKFKLAADSDILLLTKLRDKLASLPLEIEASEIQNSLYEVARETGYEDTKIFFKDLYGLLLGQEEGPRMGSFISLFGINNTIKLVEEILIK